MLLRLRANASLAPPPEVRAQPGVVVSDVAVVVRLGVSRDSMELVVPALAAMLS